MKAINYILVPCAVLIIAFTGNKKMQAQDIVIKSGGVLTVNGPITMGGPNSPTLPSWPSNQMTVDGVGAKVYVENGGLLNSSANIHGSITGYSASIFKGVIIAPTPQSNPNITSALDLENFTISHSNIGVYSIGTSAENNQRVLMFDVDFSGCTQHVEFSYRPNNLSSLNPIEILDCTFSQNGHIWPFWFKHANNVTIANCLFDFPSSNIIVHARGTNNFTVSNCTMIGMTTAVVDMHGEPSSNVTIVDNNFLACEGLSGALLEQGLVVVGGMDSGTVNDLKVGRNTYCNNEPSVLQIGSSGGTYTLGTFPGPDIPVSCRMGGSDEDDTTEETLYPTTDIVAATLVNVNPNPNNGQFNIELKNNDETALIEVYDLMGKQVFSQNNVNQNISIDIKDHTKGMYFVRISIGNEVYIEKIIYQ